MIRLVLVFVLLAVVAAIAAWVAERPGLVVLEWQSWRVETRLWVLLVLLAGLLLVAAGLDRLWRRLRAGHWLSSNRREAGRRRRGYLTLTEGMAAVAAGDAEAARKLARRAEALLEEPQATLLLTAQAAQLNDDEATAGRAFSAMLDHPETEFLGLRGLMAQAVRRDDSVGALALARRAHALRPGTPWVITALIDLESAAGNWAEAGRALEAAVRHRTVASEAARHNNALFLHERAQACERAGEAREALALAEKAAGLQPDSAPLVAHAAALAAAAGKDRRASRLIEDAWASAPHPELARAYAALEPDEAGTKRAARFERLAARAPTHPESRLALAEAALAAELWGLARGQLEPLVAAGPSARVGRLMAVLEEGLGDPVAAKDWLVQAASAPTEPAWRCANCHKIAPRLSALCPHCDGLGTLAWRAADGPPAPDLGLATGVGLLPALAAGSPTKPSAPSASAVGSRSIDAAPKRGVA